MNLRVGYIRAVTSVLFLWSAFWGWTYIDAKQEASELQATVRVLSESKAKDPTTGDPNSDRYSAANVKFWEDQINDAVRFRDEAIDRKYNGFAMLWQGIIGIVFISLAIVCTCKGSRRPPETHPRNEKTL